MSIKHILKSFTTIRKGSARVAAIAVAGITLSSVADQTINTDTTLTADVSGKLTVEDGASVRIGESITVGSYAINSGTLTVAAGKTFKATDSASNYLGVDAANEGSYSHTGNVGAIVLEENAVMEDKSNSEVHLFTSRLGSEARIVVGSGARFDMGWKYIKANGNTSNSNRNGNNRLVLDLSGQMTVGEILTMDWFYNGGASGNPRSWPTNMVVNLHEGGTLSIRSIQQSWDTAQSLFNFDGGTLKFRWDCDFLHDNNPPADFHFETGSRGVLNTDGHNVNLTSANKIFLSGGGAMEKSGNGTLTINPSFCDSSDFTGDIYLTGGTLNFPIVADGITRKVYFQGGALAVPENGTFVTVANGGSVEFVSVDGAYIKLISNGNAKLCPAGSTVRCSGTGKPVFEGSFAPGGELSFGSDSNGAFGSALPAGVAYGKVGTGTDTLIVNGLSDINIHEGKLRTGKFRFYRWIVDAKCGGGDHDMQIAEMIVWDANGQVNYSEKGCTASQYGEVYGNQGPEHAIDGYLNKWFNFHSISAGNCWLQLEFPEPIQLTGYAWFTADDCYDTNSSDCRSPSAWHWLASTDGENWVEIARVTDFTAPSSENTQAGYWGFGSTDISGVFASSTITIDTGASLLIDKAETVKVGNIVNNGGAVELTQAGSVLNVGTDSTTYLLGGGVTGHGGIEKTGSGTTRANGVNTYSGDTVISNGTYAIVPSQTAAPKFFRFTFQNTHESNTQFAWLKLCSADGTIQSTDITDCGEVGENAKDLAPGTYSRVTDFNQWGDGNFSNVFDADADSKFGGSINGALCQVVFRLRDDAANVAYYDVMTGRDDTDSPGRRLTSFRLEASIDGESWQTVSEVAVPSGSDVKNKAWYSGTSCGYFVRHVTGTTTDTTIPATSTVEVKPGATLAVQTGMTISKLRINLDDEKSVLADGSATPGSIVGFTPVRNGRLELVCNDSEIQSKIAAREEISIALDFESISTTAKANLNSWKCTLNGNRCTYRLVPSEGAGNSKLKPKGSFVFFVR